MTVLPTLTDCIGNGWGTRQLTPLMRLKPGSGLWLFDCVSEAWGFWWRGERAPDWNLDWNLTGTRNPSEPVLACR